MRRGERDVVSSNGLAEEGEIPLATPTRQLSVAPNESAIALMDVNAAGTLLYTASNNQIRIWDLRR